MKPRTSQMLDVKKLKNFGYLEKKRSFQEVTISDFFDEINLESSFQHQDQIKKNQEKKDLSRSDSNCRVIQVSFINETCLQ